MCRMKSLCALYGVTVRIITDYAHRGSESIPQRSDSTQLYLPIAPDLQVTQTPHAGIDLGHNVQNENASPCRKYYNQSGENFQHCLQRF